MDWTRTADMLPKYSGDYLALVDSGQIMQLPYSAKHEAFNTHDTCKPRELKRNAIPVVAWTEIPIIDEEVQWRYVKENNQ